MKKKKIIKAKSWQIFSYYIMPFILGIITFFGFSKIVISGSYNKLYILPNLINKLNQDTILSLLLSLTFIGIGYFIYYVTYTEADDNKINFNRITSRHIIIQLIIVIIFYFLPNIFVFLYNVASILIHDEKYKYTYLLIHILWTYSIFGLIYYKDKDIVKIMKIHYSFVLFMFTMFSIITAELSQDSFITILLEHRLRTVGMFWVAFCLPFIAYLSQLDTDNTKKYKDFLFENDCSDILLLVSSGCIIILCVLHSSLSNIFTKAFKNLVDTTYNLIIKLNSISYIPVILTILTVIFIGFAIYKTKKYLKEK